MPNYQPHAPGSQPNQGDRNGHGVQQFAAKPQPDPCPNGMVLDPATGECIAEEGNES